MTEEQIIEKFRDYLKSNVEYDNSAFDDAVQYFRIFHLKKGDYFVEQNKTCRYFGFIVSGLMRAYQVTEKKERTTCLCGENAFASATTSFIAQTPSNVNIQAIDETFIVGISKENIEKLYKKHPFWLHVGKSVIEKEIVFLDCKDKCFGSLNATEKYKMLINDNPQIARKVPLQYIASFLGIAPETLSRIRNKIAKGIS